jgi:hypothetical protein
MDLLKPLLAAYRAEYTDAPSVLVVQYRIRQLAKSSWWIWNIAERMRRDQAFYCEAMKAIADLFVAEPTREQLIDTGIWFCGQMLDKEGKSNG